MRKKMVRELVTEIIEDIKCRGERNTIIHLMMMMNCCLPGIVSMKFFVTNAVKVLRHSIMSDGERVMAAIFFSVPE